MSEAKSNPSFIQPQNRFSQRIDLRVILGFLKNQLALKFANYFRHYKHYITKSDCPQKNNIK